jgi:alpha-D-ribose 1-methylphosphonate 5-triphosphate diphosphatase
MPNELVLTNARIVLEDRILSGSVRIVDGVIADVSEGNASSGEDFGGDYLIPGLVELHTDHLEIHYSPRAGLRWNKTAAIQAHDAQVASSGITTVFDCLRMGAEIDSGFRKGEMREMADAISKASAEGRLRAEHLLHLRCEVSTADVLDHVEDFAEDRNVKLISLMDHAPGQRQFQTMDQYIMYYKTSKGLSDAEFADFVRRRLEASDRYARPHREALARFCAERGIALASHDDATLDHVDEAVSYGTRLAEFPTSVDAARASHEAGMSVLMGAPNVVRGGSHSGNIAAADLAKLGLLDVLSSDYVPLSLMHAPFILADTVEGLDLPKAIALVTATPARTVHLDDRGRIAPGLRADLVRVERHGDVPVVRSVWRQGKRVA